MRRAVPLLAATGATLAFLATFHTSPAPNGTAIASDASDTLTSTAAPETTRPVTTRQSPATTTASTVAPSTTPSTAPPAGSSRTLVGPIATNRWGEVQVSVTLQGTTIVRVQALRLPGENSHSAALSRTAEPTLRKEVLQAQNAHIDVVSGATLTSESYIESLQGALDSAGR